MATISKEHEQQIILIEEFADQYIHILELYKKEENQLKLLKQGQQKNTRFLAKLADGLSALKEYSYNSLYFGKMWTGEPIDCKDLSKRYNLLLIDIIAKQNQLSNDTKLWNPFAPRVNSPFDEDKPQLPFMKKHLPNLIDFCSFLNSTRPWSGMMGNYNLIKSMSNICKKPEDFCKHLSDYYYTQMFPNILSIARRLKKDMICFRGVDQNEKIGEVVKPMSFSFEPATAMRFSTHRIMIVSFPKDTWVAPIQICSNYPSQHELLLLTDGQFKQTSKWDPIRNIFDTDEYDLYNFQKSADLMNKYEYAYFDFIGKEKMKVPSKISPFIAGK